MIIREARITLFSICLLSAIPLINAMDTITPNAPLDIDRIISNPRLYIEHEYANIEDAVHQAWIEKSPMLNKILRSNLEIKNYEKILTYEDIDGKGISIQHLGANNAMMCEYLGPRIAFKNGHFNDELTNFLGIPTVEDCKQDCLQSDNERISPQGLIIKCTCNPKAAYSINDRYIPTSQEILKYCTQKEDIFSSIDPITKRHSRAKNKPFIPCALDNDNFFIIKKDNRMIICRSYFVTSIGYISYPKVNVYLIDLTRSLWLRSFYEERIPLLQLALLAAINKERKVKPYEHHNKKQLVLTLKEQSIFNGLLPDMKNALNPYVIPHESSLTRLQKLTRLVTTTFSTMVNF